MTKASENEFPKVTFTESASPGTPTSGNAYMYGATSGTPYWVDDTGTESAMIGAGGGGAGDPPDCYQVYLTSDVVIPNANTVQDVLSLSLPAGDWLLLGTAAITSANAAQTQLTIALFDGTSIVADAQVLQQSGVGGVTQTAHCAARITLAGTTTVKLQAFDVRASNDGTVDDTNSSNGTADKGTVLIALACNAAN